MTFGSDVCCDFWLRLLVVTFGFLLLVLTFGCDFWLRLLVVTFGWNWGLGLGIGIGIGDWKLGIGIGNWEMGREFGFGIGCDFWF